MYAYATVDHTHATVDHTHATEVAVLVVVVVAVGFGSGYNTAHMCTQLLERLMFIIS